MHFVCRRVGRFLWDSTEVAQKRRRPIFSEHASKKIRSSKRLELYIFLNVVQNCQKMLRRMDLDCDPAGHLQECFLGNRRKCSGECFRSAFWGFPKSAPESAPESARKIRSAPASAPESAFPHSFPRKSTPGSTRWGTPNFPGTLGGTLRGTFWESPESTPKALAGALSAIPQEALL